MKARPVFIHALFRTGSTYIWNKFRQLPGYVCYYEPFHQLLGGVTVDNVQDVLTRNFKAAGHPELDRHYLYEYEPLLRPGEPGVPFFRKELSFDWFCRVGDAAGPDQKRYIDFLIQACGSRVPLFQFNRTALRSAWFKSAYPHSLNIYLHRDPRDQWQSYAALQSRTGFDVFFIMDVIALSKNRDDKRIRPLWEALPLLSYHSDDYAGEESFYRVLSQAYGEQEKYFIFYYLWLLALLENAAHADMLWDINALAADPDYRAGVQRWLQARKAGSLEFSDCHITRYSAFPLPPEAMAAIEDRVQGLIAGNQPHGLSREAVRRLPAGIASRLRAAGGVKPVRSRMIQADGRNGDWIRLAERMTDRLLDGWRRKVKTIDSLVAELKIRSEQVSRFSESLARGATEAGERGREIEELKGALAEREGTIGRLQGDLNDKDRQIEALTGTLSEEDVSILQLRGDLNEKGREIGELQASLAERESSIRRLSGKLEELGRTVKVLSSALAETELAVGRLQDELQENERTIGELNGALREKTAAISLLRNNVAILQNSHSFRLGRFMLLPLRMGKKLICGLQTRRAEQGLPESEIASLAAMPPARERKIALADQLRLDFGLHRSGLKYGLRFLLGLHHPQGVALDAFIERTFSWLPQGNHAHEKPWIGFIHVPPNLPKWFHPEQSNAAIFASESWQRSLPWCRGLFAFSRYHQRHLTELLKAPVETLRLPSETPNLKWSPEAFDANEEKKIVQVGWWLRRLHAIHQLPKTDFKKAFLDVGHPSLPALMAKEKEMLVREGTFARVDLSSVLTIPCLSNQEYDWLLSRNVVFMFLYDSSACNAIVECMVRHTPLLINPLEAVVEYLGPEYPFYFETLPEAAAKLMDRDLILRTHDYLRRLPTIRELSGESFHQAFVDSGIHRSLAVPPE